MSVRSAFSAVLLVAAALAAGCGTPAPTVVPAPVEPAPPAEPAAPPPVAEPAPEPLGRIVETSALPGPRREFRAAWIATVANIDWPSRAGLSTEEQKAELTALLDRAVELGLNAVVFQVRPHADALYFTPKEPWSEYLTGEQGRPPSPWYDPLQFAVEEAHARGIELHAWFNPYRAGHPAEDGPRDAQHISNTRPDLVRQYGDYLWLDPGEPEAAAHSLDVILDVVRRYDIDGVHLDDYFYPYPVNEGGRRVSFPDAESYARAQAAGETLGRDDWRRQNVDRFVEVLYQRVKAEKPWVKVGISPFGIWRPGYPESVTGFDQYAEIYADARKWQQEGWLDYFAPQLYWSIDSRGQSFPALLDWWGEQNVAGRHLWPGLYDSRVLPELDSYEPQEILDQVLLVREDPEASGTIHFSMKALLESAGSLGRQLATGPYDDPALVPPSPWLDAEAPAAPVVAVTPRGRTVDVMMAAGGPEPVRLYIVRALRGGQWEWHIVSDDVGTFVLPEGAAPVRAVAVSAIDRVGNEGPARLVDVE